MANFVSRAEELWKTSKVLPWLLVPPAIGAAIFTAYHPQSPGISIGLLACAAGIMSVRPDMHFYEKMAWILVLISFTYLEVRAINKSDQENFANLISQNSQFKDTRDSLLWLYILNQNQFTDTMSEFSRTNSREEERFNDLVEQDKRLFAHEQQLAESLNGTLLPSNEPMPNVSCGVVPRGGALLLLGDEAQPTAVIVKSFPHTVVGLIRSGSPIVP